MLYRPSVAFIMRKCIEDNSQNFQDGTRYVNRTALYIFTKGTMEGPITCVLRSVYVITTTMIFLGTIHVLLIDK